MADYKTLDDIDVAGQRVLVRADLNVPMADGQVTDASRLERLSPTLRELAARGARVVILSHFGRPSGAVVPELSLQPVAAVLSDSLARPVAFAADCIGDAAQTVVDGLGDGDIAVLENLRFHAGEEGNDPAFAAALAALGDLYVNDAFSAAHRAHASTATLAQLLPSAAGRFMQAELDALAAALTSPARPLVAIVGGAKISTKIDLLGNLSSKVDALIIGGGMANTFLNAQGVAVGRSLCEHDMAATARDIMAGAQGYDCDIILPVDGVVAPAFAAGSPDTIVAIDAVPADQMILDVGPQTVTQLTEVLRGARTLVWNGPLGAFEIPPFDQGTVALAQVAAELTDSGALNSIAGGGDTVAALNHAGVGNRFSYVSGAGGAFLEWLEGKTLPGVAALVG
ncbi:MAG: phosphoglycerate kinase [Alphaproteobacteria bacterium]|nr:phosphoglycerate kinase [Alphaproteobacteria bacterium]